MRRNYTLCLVLLLSLSASAQHNLSGSRQTSVYTYIYRLSNAETETLFRSDMTKLKEEHLHTLVDSFITQKEEDPALRPGNYLFVQAIENRLTGELKTIDDLQCKILENNRDLLIALHNKQGQLVSDAQVFSGNRKVPYNSAIQAFCLPKKKRASLVKVYYQGTVHLVPLIVPERHFWRTLSYSFPLRYVVQPIRRLVKGYHRNRNQGRFFYNTTAHEKKYRGFMAFNKPKYKPGDTVKLKAWIITQQGNPVNRPLLLRLSDRNFDTDTILATIKPYRAGGYEYSFVATDSLDLDLDEEYLLTLEEQSSRKYDLDEYDGDLDEDEYAMKRKVLMRGKFYAEEYELNTATFTARSDKQEHNRNNPVAVYCKATDENEMAIMDGRVELLVTPRSWSNKSFYASHVFLPDTLWRHTQAMESIGETKILIPDSIFPAASFDYEIRCTFLNSNNEYKTVTLSQKYKNDRQYIHFDQQTDSLHIAVMEAGKSIPVKAMVCAFGAEDDTVYYKALQLPAVIHVDPFVKFYEIEADSLLDEFTPDYAGSMLVCRSLRTKDSVTIQVSNPHHLFFWYTIFAGNKVVHRGYDNSLLFSGKTHTPKNYFVSLQYIYGNEAHRENYTISYKDKILNIQVDQPDIVYPGQQVKVDLAVTDQAGKPVADADITAFAFTRKFNNAQIPIPPYLGKLYKGRKRYNNFHELNADVPDGTIQLNWQRWSKEMGLDSIEYYRFTHPATIYTNTEPARDNITQIAPFVVLKGDIQPVHLLYVDEVPFFFSQAQHLQQYSFAVKPGKHALKIRTNNRLIQLDSIWATQGMKTFIAINADTANKTVRMQKMPDTLSGYEKNLWSKYMILVENTFDDRMGVIAQHEQLSVLNLSRSNQLNRWGNILVGPLQPEWALLNVQNRFIQTFIPEGNYVFNIRQGLIKQKQLPYISYPFNKYLSASPVKYDFKDFVLTEKDVDSLWQDFLDHRSATEDLFRNESFSKTGNGQLKISVPLDTAGKKIFVKAVFLFRYDDPDFARIYKGTSTDLGYVQPGRYRLLLLFKNNSYFIRDSLRIRKDGINYYETGTIIPRLKDSTSIRLDSVLNNRETGWRSYTPNEDLSAIKQTFNERYFDPSSFSRLIYGHVSDGKSGEPITGATILVKGMRTGTVSDSRGNFQLHVPERGTIEALYVGYSKVSKKITEDNNYNIQLMENLQALSEVVVIGYGTSRKMSVTGSVSSVSADQLLMGRAAGLMIRGNSSITDSNQPLVIVDGLPVSGGLDKLDKDLIADISILKPSSSSAIYGSRAANGVIIVTTKKKAAANAAAPEEQAIVPGNVLRKNFRDDAYWQPRLSTDQYGKASFTTTFPDDITNWRTFVMAMGSKKRTGFAENSVRSFKALSAALAVPQFAIAGDSIQVIGKTMSYGLDSISVIRSFSVNNNTRQESSLSFRNAHIDSFNVVINLQDSVKFKYTIRKADGYFDGEERSIPVFKQGVQETKGIFAMLEKDTSFSLQPDPSLGNITIHAEASALPVLLEEIENLGKYEYLCNEQMASKLKALLLKKKVYGQLKKEFREEKNIYELVGKLNQNKSVTNLWGWWKDNEPSLWISLHVAEALLMAEEQGYKTNLGKQALIDYLVYNFNHYTISEEITGLRLLQLLGAKVDYKVYLDTLERRTLKSNLYERLQVLELQQKANLPVSLDTLIAKQSHTMMGNIYWGEERYRFFDNSIQNTLSMYRLLKRTSNQDDLLKRIRFYFLEKRKDGKWRNTYESALILETILPDLLSNEAPAQPASFTIKAGTSAIISTFPYSNTFSNSERITITKQKGMPVYFTAFQQSWNPAPARVAGDFTVTTSFESSEQVKKMLKAGEPVTLKVKVLVKADADYVMVEIPIPAGCSYKDKQQGYSNNEVHREYFKNKVSIFCSSLTKGEYTFNVSLLPRYNGVYHLNPAKAEMMYFPVFYGREEMKKIRID
jgi:TonB-dependent SusC/RagA subfamily outer membrane receptor